MSSLDRILPFLRPIEDLLSDPAVTDVMVNDGGARVFVGRDGRLHPVPNRRLEERSLTVAIKNIARACGDDISDAQPLLDARLEDGSRVAAMIRPCAATGAVLTIRKFTRRYTLNDLVSAGALTETCASMLVEAVVAQRNILIAGGTGTGKTTLLNALAAHVPDEERVIVIEDTAEIHLTKANVVRCEARRAQMPLGQEAPLPAVTIADLLRATLRHGPDRILVGELRGAEGFEWLQALTTHRGSVTTIHATSAEHGLTRLAHCVLMANVGLPYRSIREDIASVLNLVVYVARVQGVRRVQEVVSIEGYDSAGDRFTVRHWNHTDVGRRPEGAAV